MRRAAVMAAYGSLLAGAAWAQAPAATSADTVAIVAGKPVTQAELEALGGARLFQIRSQEYTYKKQLLDELIARRLLEKTASDRGISLEELTRMEIESKVAPVSDADRQAFYDKNKSRFGSAAEADALKQVGEHLRQQAVRERRNQFVAELRRTSGVRVLMEPPRQPVAADDDPSLGPATAPVTVVEFSDFQCPFCAQVPATLKRLREKYGDKVRIVYRDFPITQIHKDAAKAAEAATCAGEQGKFWEMHDALFAAQSALQVPALKEQAAKLGLDATAFDVCLDSGRHAAEWQKDQADGVRYGVSATPAFFVNGRFLVGAVPFESFAEVIDEELERAGTAKPPSPPAKPGP